MFVAIELKGINKKAQNIHPKGNDFIVTAEQLCIHIYNIS